MSNSQDVALQADVGNIPTNELAALGNLQSLMRATTADDVHPTAVEQPKLLGSCYHINGAMAMQVPDLLARSNSVRLERLQL